jgi:hypothetical protein
MKTIEELTAENARLRALVAELALDAALQKLMQHGESNAT